MLVDAAKHGDVEIPVFCYEPKLGEPVGACRMCLVEIEGIPKLQTACSTPVRDGMVVYTQTDRVKEAQNAVVEFLLVNHPLDCPVCDKGGECPLQDIAMGWGPGKSRVDRPQAPLPEADPALAADQDRPRALHPLLPLRPLQPGGRRGRAAPAPRARRLDASSAPSTTAPTSPPSTATSSSSAPSGALTSEAYRFRARPWDIEDAGIGLHALPEPVQHQAHRPRRADPAGPRPRQPRGRRRLALRQGPLRLPDDRVGRADHRAAGPRAAASFAPASWERGARGRGRRACAQAGERTAAIVGGSSSNEEGYLVQRIVRRALGSPHVDLAPPAARAPTAGALRRALAARARPRSVSDLDRAESILVLGTDPLHAMPILDLRIRKAVRRNGARLVVATDRPTALDGGAEETARYAPGLRRGASSSALAGEARRRGLRARPGRARRRRRADRRARCGPARR